MANMVTSLHFHRVFSTAIFFAPVGSIRRVLPALIVVSILRTGYAVRLQFLSVGSASARATHGYPLRTAKRGTRHRGSVRSRLLRPSPVGAPILLAQP